VHLNGLLTCRLTESPIAGLLFAKVLNVMKGMRSWAFEFMEFPQRIYIYYTPYLLFMLAVWGGWGLARFIGKCGK